MKKTTEAVIYRTITNNVIFHLKFESKYRNKEKVE